MVEELARVGRLGATRAPPRRFDSACSAPRHQAGMARSCQPKTVAKQHADDRRLQQHDEDAR
jgi:hypothetical protein